MDLADEIIYGDYKSVQHAIESGLEINELDKYGFSPLIESVIVDKPEITKLLLDKGALVDGMDLTGRTPLHWAVETRNLSICKSLLDHKADPNAYTKACQPVLTFPLLRKQEDLKDLLYYYGANLNFAQDYINTKLVGHRFELTGKIHMLSCDGQFILVDFEGFFLEFTLGIIQDSLRRYKNNYAARHITHLFPKIDRIIECLIIASELIRYQHFSIKYQEFEDKIDRLLDYPLLLIPVAYEGHAITCIRYGDLWVKCDRGFNSRVEGSVVIYRSLRPKLINKKFIKNLIYRKNSYEYVNEGLNEQIGLVKVAEIPLPAQVIGNCSWANVEASIAAMMFLLMIAETDGSNNSIMHAINQAIDFFDVWREWDKDRALEECIQSYYHANVARKATKTALLATVLTQTCRYNVPEELARAEKIFPILAVPEFQYVLQSYMTLFIRNNKTELGENLKHLLDLAAPKEIQDLI